MYLKCLRFQCIQSCIPQVVFWKVFNEISNQKTVPLLQIHIQCHRLGYQDRDLELLEIALIHRHSKKIRKEKKINSYWRYQSQAGTDCCQLRFSPENVSVTMASVTTDVETIFAVIPFMRAIGPYRTTWKQPTHCTGVQKRHMSVVIYIWLLWYFCGTRLSITLRCHFETIFGLFHTAWLAVRQWLI